MTHSYDTDTLTQRLGVLVRRETEARVLIPVARSLAKAQGAEAVEAIMGRTIRDLAASQGRELAQFLDDNSLNAFKEGLAFWSQDGALELAVEEATETRLKFKVTRCKYAEMYRALTDSDEEAAAMGKLLSCNRDEALMDGFNPQVRLDRPTTIMAGDAVCEFCYTLEK